MATPLQSAALPQPPGPRGRPIVGNLIEAQRDALAFYLSLVRQYGYICRFNSLYPYYGYFVGSPQGAEHILRTHQHNYPKGPFGIALMKLLAGEGLLASEGDLWLRQRRLIQPAFHRSRLASFATTMSELAEETAEQWQPAAAGGAVLNIAAEMMRLTLRIVGCTLFSIDVQHEADAISPALTVALEHTNFRSTHPFAIPEKYPTPRNRRYRAAVRTLDQVVQDIVDQRRRTGERPDDLLDMLLQARDEATGTGMSDHQLRDEVRTLLLAGHETTANALAWTWYLLARHPRVEDALHSELRDVLGGRTPTLDDLPRLPYTRMVIDEAMRLYPPAWALIRQSVNDDEIDGYRIDGNTVIGLSPYVTHRHPEYWPDPERFDPERFTPERVAERPKFAYFPFGGGPRLCIGNNFALMEAQLIVATLAQRYRLRLAVDRPVEYELVSVLRPKGGVPMRLERRA